VTKLQKDDERPTFPQRERCRDDAPAIAGNFPAIAGASSRHRSRFKNSLNCQKNCNAFPLKLLRDTIY